MITKGKSYADNIKSAESQTELRKVIATIRADSSLDNLSISDLVGKIQKKAKNLGITWRVSDVRNDIRPKVKTSGLPTGDNAPDWVKDWVYLVNQDKFIIPGTSDPYTRSGFRGLYGREMDILAEIREEPFMEADIYALNKARIMTVHDVMYCPSASSSQTFTFENNLYVNSYSPDSHGDRKPRSEWTPEDKAAVELFDNHIKQMFDKPGEAVIVKDTLAYICQKGASQRIEWMLIIKGCEGDGKTLILNACAACVGDLNTGVINAEEMIEHHFSNWAAGHIFKQVEELKMPDENRHATLNKLKPYITNKVISIHPKGRPAYKGMNTASYIACTNYVDCLPLSDAHRRFTIATSKWQIKADVLRHMGHDYFKRLFNATEEHTSAINEYLMTHEISPNFSPFDAPETESRRELILLNRHEVDIVIQDIVESGKYKDINTMVVDTKTLSQLLEMEYDITLLSRQLSDALLRLGYSRIPWQIKIHQSPRRFYIKGIRVTGDRKTINQKIRDLLELPF
jgi:hypothetical protein